MVAELETRLRRLEDEREIIRTLHAYGHALDYGYEDRFLDCFLPDGILIWPSVEPIVGHQELRSAFRAHTHAPQVYHKHFMVEPIILLEESGATVDSLFARIDCYDGNPEIRSFGRYRDRLQRCGDGRWRFKERKAELEARRANI